MKEAEKTKNKEIMVGQTVPVLEHPGCAGTQGTVVTKNGPDYDVECNTCHRPAIIDLH